MSLRLLEILLSKSTLYKVNHVRYIVESYINI